MTAEPAPGEEPVVIARGALARMRELEHLLAGESIEAQVRRPGRGGGGG